MFKCRNELIKAILAFVERVASDLNKKGHELVRNLGEKSLAFLFESHDNRGSEAKRCRRQRISYLALQRPDALKKIVGWSAGIHPEISSE